MAAEKCSASRRTQALSMLAIADPTGPGGRSGSADAPSLARIDRHTTARSDPSTDEHTATAAGAWSTRRNGFGCLVKDGTQPLSKRWITQLHTQFITQSIVAQTARFTEVRQHPVGQSIGGLGEAD